MHGVRLGKREVKPDRRNLKLAKYLPKKLPRIPGHVRRSNLVPSWPMYANDRLGDCTCAAVGHLEQLYSTAAGAPETPTETAVLDLYWRTGSADDGRYCLDILNMWRAAGFGSDRERIMAFAQINPENLDHVKLAVALFGAVYTGIALPQTAQGADHWRLVRGAGSEPGSWGGHCVPIVDYDRRGAVCVTWGQTLRMTWGFWKKYVDEAYVVLSPDWIEKTGVAASGVKLDALEKDLAALRAA